MEAAQFPLPGQGTHPSAPVLADNGSQVAPALENCPLLKIKLFIYGCAGSLLLRGLFSSCDAWGLLSTCGFLLQGLLLLQNTGARATIGSCSSLALEQRLNCCGARAYLPCGMWDLPRLGAEPTSPALAGESSTTEPPGKLLENCTWPEGHPQCTLAKDCLWPVGPVLWCFCSGSRLQLGLHLCLALVTALSQLPSLPFSWEHKVHRSHTPEALSCVCVGGIWYETQC